MKKIRLMLLFIILVLFSFISYVYAIGHGIAWIYNVTDSSRFENHSSDTAYGTGYYLDTYTGLKWQAHDTTMTGDSDEAKNSRRWAIDNNYTEPTWDSDNGVYNYPSGRIAADYPAFKHCEDIGNGWRLPTKNELFSIIVDTKAERYGNTYYTALPSISNNSYWSSTSTAHTSNDVWYVRFNTGNMGDSSKDDTHDHIICVHD